MRVRTRRTFCFETILRARVGAILRGRARTLPPKGERGRRDLKYLSYSPAPLPAIAEGRGVAAEKKRRAREARP